MKALENFKKGSVLLTTLWIVAILTLLAMGIGFRASLEVRLGKYAIDRLEARYLAKAGIVKARQYLNDSKTQNDTLYACGIKFKNEETPETVFGDEYNELGNGSFSVHYMALRMVESGVEGEEEYEVRVAPARVYGVEDEERKININMSKLTAGNKTEYIKILERLLPDPEGEETLTRRDVINAIMDWQDTDGPAGDAENNYYEGLDHPYKCKNSDFDLIEELLLVKGVTPAFFEKIKGNITVYGEGKVNANTAPAEVLTAIIGYPDLVEEVVKYRKGTDGEEETEDDRFWTGADGFAGFLKSKGLKAESAGAIKQYFTAKSDNFRIASHGTVGKVTSGVTCVVKRESGSPAEKKVTYEYYHEE